MVRLVLFDIDGTLVRTGGAGVKAFAKVFKTEFGATDGFERLKFSGRTDISQSKVAFVRDRITALRRHFCLIEKLDERSRGSIALSVVYLNRRGRFLLRRDGY